MTHFNRLMLNLLMTTLATGQTPLFADEPNGLATPDFQQLWPEGAPDAKGDTPADQPAVWIYRPTARPNGTAVVICPGGGYAIHATDHEGVQPARFFNRMGVTAVVLRYRLSPYRHPVPLGDAQRAIRYLRHHAEDLEIDPHRIGIMGFSAGGHLTSTAVTHFDSGRKDSADPIEQHSSRPDFGILGYPVVSFVADYAHQGSGRNLLGNAATEEQLQELSNDQHVSTDTPPVFLFHTSEDGGVPPQNSLAFFTACHQAGVAAELHVYQQGPHGVGMGFGHPALQNWMHHAGTWLRQNSLLTSKKQVPVEGNVEINGKPLRWGSIAFQSDDQSLPVGWGMINKGRFNIPAKNGPVPGHYNVVVTDMGQIEPQPVAPDARVSEPVPVTVTEHPSSMNFTLEIMPSDK